MCDSKKTTRQLLQEILELVKKDNEWRRLHLGSTAEEQTETLRLFEDLTPAQLREAVIEYRKRLDSK